MRKDIIAGFSIMLLAGVLGASVAMATTAVHRASGGGTVDWPLARVTYGFTAEIDADGVVTGEAEFQHRDLGVHNHVEITCLTVIGNDAWIGGVIRESNIPELVGVQIVWRVQDNGEGTGNVDKTSIVVPNTTLGDCNLMPALGLIPWTSGNVLVK
ncbi:MAG TPA: hypothetical protein VGK89_01990 [Candidatus Eisenbacteria bacterium]|jgi:hypothetical protein